MSVKAIFDGNSKISAEYLPNPYPFKAQTATLGETLQAGSSAFVPNTLIKQDATDFKILGCETIFTGEVVPGNNNSIKVGDNSTPILIQGAIVKGSMLVGNGIKTESLPIPSGPALPNGSVLILDDTTATGVRWGGESGDINSITPGTNIDISGSTANPIVALQTPLTSTLALGTQNVTGTTSEIILTDTGAPLSIATMAADTLVYTDSVSSVNANLQISKGGVVVSSALNTTELIANGLAGVGGATMVIQNNATGGNLELNTNLGAGIISTDSSFKPLRILDNATVPSTGTSGQYLTAGAGGSTLWTTPPAGVASVSAGTNISVTGTASAPIVNLQNPLTATVNLGSQNLSGGLGLATPNSVWNYQGLNFFVGGPGGGSVEGQYLPNSISLTTPLSNTGSVSITPLQIGINGPAISPDDETTMTPLHVQVQTDNNTTGALERATLTKQSLAYVIQDSGTPTLTDTSTYDNCSRTAVSLDVTTGATATRTEIIDKNLQSRQQQTLVQPSSGITSTINSNCEIIASVPQAYLQLITDDTSSVQTGAFGVSAQQNQAEMGVSYNNTNPGNEYQGQGNITTTPAGTTCLLTSSNIAGASSHLLRFEVPLTGDALIEHQVVGATRNLDITTPGQFSVVAGAAGGFSIATPAGAFQTGIAGNAAGSLIASGVNHLFRTTSNTSTATTPSFNFQSEGASTASYPAIKLDRPVPASGTGETIGTIGMWADDASNVSREYIRLQAKTENVSPGNVDGTLSVLAIINSSASPTEIFNFNGGQNEINTFRPFDLNGNALRTSQGDMTISTTASAGTGKINLNAKEDISMTAKQFDLTTQPTAPATAFAAIYLDSGGGMELQCDSTLQISGTNKTSATAGGNSGQHLVITINGTPYKIALLNP